jgi:hypothetical protein
MSQIPKKANLPCGCEVDMNEDDTVYGYRQDNLGIEILQCKQCKLVIGVKVEKEKPKPILWSPLGKVARG